MLLSELAQEKILPFERRYRNVLLIGFLVISDALTIGIVFRAAFSVRFEALAYFAPYDINDYKLIMLWLIPLWIIIFATMQLYNPHYLFGGLSEYARLFNGVTGGIVALIVVGFFQRDSLVISRGWLLLSWIPSFLALAATRLLIRRTMYGLRKRGHFLSPVIIVGVNEEGKAMAQQLSSWNTSGLYLVGFVDGWEQTGKHITEGYKVLGQLNDLERIVEHYGIEEIIIVPTALTRQKLLEVFRKYNTQPHISIRITSGLFDIFTTGLRVKELAHVPLIDVLKARISGVNAVMKIALEYTLTLGALILIFPFIVIIVVAIKLDSPGPAIYRRQVMGGKNKTFDAFKFRTMHINGEEILATRPDLIAELENEHKLKDDPRVTRVGKFLRKYSLDELPQLINVLAGQMSLVGPRMIALEEIEKYGEWGLNLLTVNPGITGMWQVSGRSDVTYQERVRMDMYYIRNWSIWLDLYIILKTFGVVFGGKGAY